MPAVLPPPAKTQFFDAVGDPLVGGKLFTYGAGTTVKQPTYVDSAGISQNTNPIILDARGECNLWLDPTLAYKFVLAPSTDTDPPVSPIWTVDNITVLNAASILSTLALSSGSSLIGFIMDGAGAVARTAQSKMREYVSDVDFGAVGDGVTNDTTALTNFWNHAIANPGVPHRLRSREYLITSVMPTISVPNVWIEGAGVTIHNVGSAMTGTRIKWGGAVSPASTMVTLTAVSGGANQLLSNVTFKGIGLDCNSGNIGYGMRADSIWECDIDIAVTNPSQIALTMDVVATLGETQSSQKNHIRLKTRHIEAPGGAGLRLDGSAVANVSMNFFDVDIVHMNNTAIFCVNSDNNDWHFVRCFKVPGGTATECINLAGSMNFGENCRAERFWFVTSNLPIHAYATGLTYPSSGNSIFALDTENGTPSPVIEAGAGLNWRKDVTLMDENEWVSFTPVITAASGTLTTVTGQSGEYRKMGKRVEFKFQWTITTNGTGASALLASLPITAGSGVAQSSTGRERAIGGKQLAGFIDAGSGTLAVFNYDGTYPGVNSGAYVISGFYECA